MDSAYWLTSNGKPFIFPDRLDEHLVTSHGYTARQFPCEHCNRAFAWRPSLIQHNRIHGLFKRYPCENCTKVFTESAVLQKHIRSMHVGARAHVCPECGKTFSTSSGLKQHSHIHSSVKPFQCEVCFKAYTQFSNLCRHKRMHSRCRLQIKCDKCSQAFSTVTSLAKHKRFCDTAPSLSMTPPNPPMPDFNKIPPRGYGMTNMPPTPQNSLMMYPRPPLPMLSQSILGNYPMFPSLPSLVGGPQHPLLPHSLLLPFQDTNSVSNKDSPPMSAGFDFNRERSPAPNISSSFKRISSPPQKYFQEPESMPKSFSPPTSPTKEPLRVTDDSIDSTNNQSDIEENVPALSPQRCTPSPNPDFEDSSKMNGSKKESTPLDLTTRREGLEILSMSRLTSSSSPEVPERKPSPQKDASSKSDPRTDHPFFSISDLLKEPESKVTSSTSSQPSPLTETPTKYPLAYPRPLHPSYLFDMCRNLERNSERKSILPPPMPSRTYPLIPPFFPPTSIGNVGNIGIGLHRNPGLDLLNAQFSASSRPFNELSRQYDLISPHISRPKDRYSCKFCGKVFPRSANLTRHLRTHTGEQPYKCKFCDRSFSISSNLQRHVRNIHNKEKPFRCHLCDRSFGQQTNLDRHLRHHEDGGADVPDSSSTSDTPVKYFNEEIRSFVDKVTDQSNDDIMADVDDEMDDDDERSFLEMQDEHLDCELPMPKTNGLDG